KVFDQPVVDTLGPIPYEQLNASLDASFPRGARNYWKSHFCEQLTDEAIETIIDCHRKCPSPMAMVSIEHFHGAATRVKTAKTAFALRGRGFNVLALSQWSSPAGDAAGLGWARETDAALKPSAGRVNTSTTSTRTTPALPPSPRRMDRMSSGYSRSRPGTTRTT